jgi:hypothetical protein
MGAAVRRRAALELPDDLFSEYMVREASYTRRRGALIVWALTLRDRLRSRRPQAPQSLRRRQLWMSPAEQYP